MQCACMFNELSDVDKLTGRITIYLRCMEGPSWWWPLLVEFPLSWNFFFQEASDLAFKMNSPDLLLLFHLFYLGF